MGTALDLASLRGCFSGRLITDAGEMEPFLIDWRKRWRGASPAVAQPDSTQDVAAIVGWCAAHNVTIVPQGGNTGMVGGSVPSADGRSLVLSLKRMNKVRDLDTINNTLTAEAGCVLQDIQQAARDADRLFPLSLAAEGSCTIGGNLATNAGGVQVLRFGNMRDLCLGLEVVTPQGEVWNGLRGLRKDNTGYDLRDLFIGAEGTLGVITAATLKLYPQPLARLTAIAGLASPHAALQLLELAQRRLSSSLTAFELIADVCLDLVVQHVSGTRKPLTEACPWYVLLECSDAESEAHATGRFNALMEEAFEAGIISDAALAGSMAQSRAFWGLREHIPLAQATEGDNIKHDISVPISAIGRFVEQTNAALDARFPGIRMVVFGHLGDGNLHYNVSTGPALPGATLMAAEPVINGIVYDAVHAAGGSISAEHGLGQLKVEENRHYKSPVELSLMASLKRALDPQGLMNPGKVLG